MEERGADLLAAVHGNGHGASVWMNPSFVAARLAEAFEPQAEATRRNSSAWALGMHDFGRVLRERQALLVILRRDHLKNTFQCGQRLFSSRH